MNIACPLHPRDRSEMLPIAFYTPRPDPVVNPCIFGPIDTLPHIRLTQVTTKMKIAGLLSVSLFV